MIVIGTELLVLIILLIITVGLVTILWISNRVGNRDSVLRDVALGKSQEIDEGYIGVPTDLSALVGRAGRSMTVLRPAGKIEIDGTIVDAVSVEGFIEENTPIKVTKYENTQVYVKKL